MIIFSVTCEKELGYWTVRVDGKFVCDFWFKKNAYEMSYRLIKALK